MNWETGLFFCLSLGLIGIGENRMKRNLLVPLNLQFFAEDEPEGKEPDKSVEPTPGNPEFDAAVSKAVEKALENNDKKWASRIEQATAEAKSEAEKMAKMNEEQKAEYERKQLEENFAKREAELTRRELRAQSATQLAQDGLPTDLVDVLDYSNADNCQASYLKIKDVFQKSVEKAVNQKLVQSVDNPLGSSDKPTVTNPWAKDTYNLTEQGKIMMEDPEKAKILMEQAKNK
jgi:flagellar biosynthesis GTPase FlhF